MWLWQNVECFINCVHVFVIFAESLLYFVGIGFLFDQYLCCLIYCFIVLSLFQYEVLMSVRQKLSEMLPLVWPSFSREVLVKLNIYCIQISVSFTDLMFCVDFSILVTFYDNCGFYESSHYLTAWLIVGLLSVSTQGQHSLLLSVFLLLWNFKLFKDYN